jgi:hypothetical protein
MTALLTASATLNALSLPALDERLGKVNRKAQKLGVASASYEATNYREVDIVDEWGNKTGETKMVCDVELTYADLRLPGGWRWCATIEAGELGNLVYGPDAERFSHLREAKLTCDHCSVKRFRKVHYVVANSEGEEKVVGSSCLKDFVGDSPTKVLNFHSTMSSFLDDEESWGRSSACSSYRPLRMVVEYTLRQIELAGKYIKSDYYGYSDEMSTKDRVTAALFPSSFAKKEDIEHDKPTEQNKKHAEYVIERFNEVLAKVETDLSNASEFDYKIANATKAGHVDCAGKLFAVVVGSVGFHWAKIKKEQDEQANDANPVGLEYVDVLLNAAPKSRVEFEGTVITVNEVENSFSYYGGSSTMIIIKMGSREKNLKARFFTTKDLGVKEGDVVRISAKVKNHNHHEKFGTTVNMNYPRIEK